MLGVEAKMFDDVVVSFLLRLNFESEKEDISSTEEKAKACVEAL